MRARSRALIEQCIEVGIRVGMARAYKHDDSPNVDRIADQIEQAIMNEVDEWFTFPEEGREFQ